MLALRRLADLKKDDKLLFWSLLTFIDEGQRERREDDDFLLGD